MAEYFIFVDLEKVAQLSRKTLDSANSDSENLFTTGGNLKSLKGPQL